MKRVKPIVRGLLLWYFPTDREYRIMRRWKRILDAIAGAAWKILLGMASVSGAKRRLAPRRSGAGCLSVRRGAASPPGAGDRGPRKKPKDRAE